MADVLTYVLHYEGEFNKNSLGAVSEGPENRIFPVKLAGNSPRRRAICIASPRRESSSNLITKYQIAIYNWRVTYWSCWV